MEAAPFSSASGAKVPGTQKFWFQIRLLHVLLLRSCPVHRLWALPDLIGSFPAFLSSLFFLTHLLPFHPSSKWPHLLALLRRHSLTRVCYLLPVFRSFVICQKGHPLPSTPSILFWNLTHPQDLSVCVYYLRGTDPNFAKRYHNRYQIQ